MKYMSWPNLITLFRVLLVPLLLLLLLQNRRHEALLVFLLAAAGDGLDGMIAKLFQQTTTFGTYFDPIADKFLINTAYITLAARQAVPAWLAGLIFVRDLVILSGLAVILLKKFPIIIKPLPSSKTTTLLQMLTVCFFFVDNSRPAMPVFQAVLVSLTVIFTLFSGARYTLLGYKILHGNQS